MKFGIFYEHQLPRPWDAGAEHRLYREALEQVELADRLGIDHAWEVEHHFLEEYSHSSAPEVFLAACSQRTRRIRLGHGITLMPPAYNHPARIAERIAALDLVSDGRVEFGTGESSSLLELGGFGVSVADKRAAWQEALEQCLAMMVETPYPGFAGRFFSMPCRNVLPKPVQKPHPPMWMACTNRETIKLAASLGLGALAFAFADPEEARSWSTIYYDIIRSEACVPLGWTVNANIAMVSAFSIHRDRAEAIRRGQEGFEFFVYALNALVAQDSVPGHSRLWPTFLEKRGDKTDRLIAAAAEHNAGQAAGIGTPDDMRRHLLGYQEAGIDQIIFLQQAGRNRHDHICEALSLFAAEVMPAFKAEAAAREAKKAERLAPFIERALARKPRMRPLAEHEIPVVRASADKAKIGGTVG